MAKRCDLVIINRSFWPKSQVLGEALLQLGETAAKTHKVCVITQSDVNLQTELDASGRGENVVFRACKSHSNSATHLLWRVVDVVIFMLWTFWSLVLTRPQKVYISTDPPVLVPFVVFIYAKLFRAQYFYHLQDIHPEAANIIIPLNKWVYKFLRGLDSIVMRHASALVTLTDSMRQVIMARSGTKSPIHLVDNAAVVGEEIENLKNLSNRQPGFVFAGNAGRLQRIPLLLAAIKAYYLQGGCLPFVFAGGGVFSGDISKMASEFENLSYLGVISPSEAQELNARYEWALLPIDDEVTRYAYPSKISAYLVSCISILSICSDDTSVAKWINANGYGTNVIPDQMELAKAFFAIERREVKPAIFDNAGFRKSLSIPSFVDSISRIIFDR